MRFYWFWLVPLLLLTCWLGARGLNADPIWFDEHYSIYLSGGVHYGPLAPWQIWERAASEDPWHPPMYYIALSGWGALVGWQPPALRALSLFGGLLAVAWTYRLGRTMVSARVGLYAAVVLGVSAFFVYYLHELRNYSFFALFTALTLWCYWRIIHHRPSRRLWIVLFLSSAATLYIHYLAALPLAAIGLYHLLFVRKDRRWWQVVGVLALAGMLYLPWLTALFSAIDQIGDDQLVRRTAATASQIVERQAYLLGNGSVLLAVLALLLAVTHKQATAVGFFMLATLALPLVLNALLPIMPLTRMRYLLGLWPLLALGIALGIDRLPRHLPVVALVLWLALGAGMSVNPDFISGAIADGAGSQWHLFPWHVARDLFRPYTQPGDTLVLNIPDGLGRIPLPEHRIPDFYLSGSSVRIAAIGSRTTPEEEASEVESVMSFVHQSPRVWVAYEPERRSIILPPFEEALSEKYGLCEVGIAQSTFHFDLYSRSSVCCLPGDEPPLMRFGEGIDLVRVETLPETVMDTVPVTLSWAIGEGVPPYTYSVALHVEDADGQLAAQADFGLPASSTACQETRIPVDNLPAGEYRVYVIVYAWASGERLAGEVMATGETGERLALGVVEKRDE